MIPKAERDADAAILAAATGGTWITVAPRSQEGGVQLAGFGGLDAPDVAVSLRVAGEWSLATVEQQGEMSWGQRAANAKAAAHAVNRLPVYIEAAAEMERRIAEVEAERGKLARKLASATIGSGGSQPEMVAAREHPDAEVCADPECRLSGGFAHVGDCTLCDCGKRHAAEECPR